MAYAGLSILAVVPARGGSKAIPRKNLQPVVGLSLVARAAQVAKAVAAIDAAVLSTDDAEISTEGRAHGLDTPFVRPAELASDTASSVDMWRHAWLASEAHYGQRFDISVLLEPTSPLRQAADIDRVIRVLVDDDRKAAATVSQTPAHHTPEKTLTLDDSGVIRFYHADGAAHTRRQTIPSYYHRNGICYAAKRATLVDHGNIIEEDCAAVVIDRPVVNIDEPFELELAEWLLQQHE